MHDVLLVHVVESFQYLLDDICRLTFVELLLHLNLFEQIATTHELSHDVEAAIVFQELKDTRDVRVLRLLKDLQLVDVELFVDLVHSELLLLDEFDSARHFGFAMHAQFDCAKRARSQRLLSRVVLGQVLLVNLLKLHLSFVVKELLLCLLSLRTRHLAMSVHNRIHVQQSVHCLLRTH